ncbi:bifunctional DNA primase/polymerase [uncultured Lentilactobacillus sp.]|nr:bifunctional DNA primase/polymerase [uncultured Lentilactobacillus sp.]
MRNLVNYAIKYAKFGFSVLPMAGKRPLIKFADQPPLTVEQVKQVWKKYPYANIALRTIKFFVVDIDVHENEANGFDSIKQYEHPEYFRKTLEQKTAGGGRQLLYLKRDDMTIQQNIGWLPGVDIKAHPNNYVVVAPSSNHGKLYEWLNKRPIVTASPELVKAINQEKITNYTPEDLKFSGGKTTTTHLFEQITQGLGETGGRNNALAAFIGGLLFRNVDAEIVYQLAMMANQNTPKSLSTNEFNRTFDSMVKKEIKRREDSD